MSVRILLLGAGGREHALAWKLSQSSLLDHTYVCPGNAGTSQEPKTTNVTDISPDDFPQLVQFALKHDVRLRYLLRNQLTYSYSRLTLLYQDLNNLWLMEWRHASAKVRTLGVSYQINRFRALSVGIPVFGPSALAARMEGSKAFSKDFMARHNIPTAQYKTFQSSEFEAAVNYVKTCGHEVVLKASGLAGGKGVLIPQSTDEAVEGLKEIMVNSVFGDAGM